MAKKTIFSEMWDSYRGVIMHSIVTSFGLDFIVKDQAGGDVDTIHGVRETGQYKNARNAADYDSRGSYDSVAYHHNEAYDGTIRTARERQEFMDDAYVPGNRVFYGKAAGLGTDRKANLDHVISAKEIHDDRGRALAGLDGVELANQSPNLQFTNEHLNKSMRDMSIDEYIQWRADRGDPLPEDQIAQMREKDAVARENMDRQINMAYYSSDKFLLDAAAAAANRGLEMGARQALGFVFIELWCACEDEVKALPAGVSFSDCMSAVAVGLRKGMENAMQKHKQLLSQFEQGFMSGALASMTTTLINIFVTTDKNTVRYIRQVSTTVVQVGNILLVNPHDLLLGDQLKEATVALATGASILAGTAVGNQIARTPVGQDERFGTIVQTFCSSLVSGLLSCTLLIMVDRSKFMHDLVAKMNHFGSVDHDIRETAAAFVQLAAEVAECDISEFQQEVALLEAYTSRIAAAVDDDLHDILVEMYEEFELSTPWEGDFDSFMSDPNNFLVFE